MSSIMTLPYPCSICLNQINVSDSTFKCNHLYKYQKYIDICIENNFSIQSDRFAVEYLIKHPDEIDWYSFSMDDNDKAVNFLIKNHKINWETFSRNENDKAVEFLIKNHPDKINLDGFSENSNPLAVDFLIKNPDKINWAWFSMNKSDKAVEFLIKNPDKIIWMWFSLNTNQTAVDFLINQHPNKITCYWFSLNTNQIAVDFLIEHPDKIDFSDFSKNSNPAAVEFLIKNPDKIIWSGFIKNSNPTAFDFLIKNYPDKIEEKENLYFIYDNPRLFDLDYQAMSLARLRVYEEELCRKAVLDPRRVKVWLDDFLERGGELIDFKFEPYSVSNF